VIDLISEDEADDEFDGGGEGWLSSIAELVGGDLPLLYLAWLFCVQNHQVPDEEAEPPVPSGLGKLTASLRAVRVSAGRSGPAGGGPARLGGGGADGGYGRVGGARLPVAEKDAALLMLRPPRCPRAAGRDEAGPRRTWPGR
jgi:hypothetical protein